MSAPLVIAVPSKGRLKDQVEAWLADCGLPLRIMGGARGYSAGLEGFNEVQVRLASAADIAIAIATGEIHLGVTGEDLLREQRDGQDAVLSLIALGFGRADLVVAAPKSWIDVETMRDVEDVAHDYLARTGRRLRVATKYGVQTRAFFARHGIADYRLSESGGATEGAPAAGAAELVVDITTTGATLAANGLKTLADGLILRSEACLAASLAADWNAPRLAECRRLLAILEARARARVIASLSWPVDQGPKAREALAQFVTPGEAPRSDTILIRRERLFAAASALSAAGVGPVSVTRPEHVFQATSTAADSLATALAARNKSAPLKGPSRS